MLNSFIYYKDGNLFVENVKVEDIVKEYGTPIYIYSANSFKNRFNNIKGVLPADALIAYSIKSNSNVNIIKLLKEEGAGADIVSRGELYRAKLAGIDGSKIVFSGVGKSYDDIKDALEYDILMFNIESLPEAELINKIASSMNKKARVSIRVNPDVDADTHHHITTGKKENKFGISYEDAVNVYKYIRDNLKNLEIIGIDTHIGSSILKVNPYKEAIGKLVNLIEDLKKEGIKLEYFDIGGGLGIRYREEDKDIDMKEWGKTITDLVGTYNLKLIVEPGRYISGNSGIFVSKVLYMKKTAHKNFIIVDGAMNDLVRPAFYDAYHKIDYITIKDRKNIIADVVGPICESGDYFAKERNIGEPVDDNEYIVIFSAGAYGYVMSSNYNSRPKSPEVLVEGDSVKLVKRRETLEDLIRDEL